MPATLIGIQLLRRLVFNPSDNVGIEDVRYVAMIISSNVDHGAFNYAACF